MSEKVIQLEDFRVVAVVDKGVAIVDDAGHYWIAYPHEILERRSDDVLAKTYREVVE